MKAIDDGSSCIYPRDCPQPMKEEYLLTGPLESTNRLYAVAKIAGIEQCWSYNRQYGTRFLAVMPTNLYGPGDNYDLNNFHVIPVLIRKTHEAKQQGDKEMVVWGIGKPRREFLYSEDMVDACVYLLMLPDEKSEALSGMNETVAGKFQLPLVNIGVGEDIAIRELTEAVKRTVGFEGKIISFIPPSRMAPPENCWMFPAYMPLAGRRPPPWRRALQRHIRTSCVREVSRMFEGSQSRGGVLS